MLLEHKEMLHIVNTAEGREISSRGTSGHTSCQNDGRRKKRSVHCVTFKHSGRGNMHAIMPWTQKEKYAHKDHLS